MVSSISSLFRYNDATTTTTSLTGHRRVVITMSKRSQRSHRRRVIVLVNVIVVPRRHVVDNAVDATTKTSTSPRQPHRYLATTTMSGRSRRRYNDATMASASLSWRQSRHVNVVVTSWLRSRSSTSSSGLCSDNVVRKSTSTSLRRYEDVASWLMSLSRRRCRHDADDVETT